MNLVMVVRSVMAGLSVVNGVMVRRVMLRARLVVRDMMGVLPVLRLVWVRHRVMMRSLVRGVVPVVGGVMPGHDAPFTIGTPA
jgi:hypothetical protein